MGKNCLFCKHRIEEKISFCPFCGKKQLVDEALVNAARQNDQHAITEIYMLSQQNVYFTIRSMVKDEDIIADLVQDTFIKVFDSLDTLQFEQEKFQAWVRRIAHNITLDYLKKKKEILFSEMEGEDSGTEIDFVDERTEYLPEAVIDREETSRLVREILNSLSDEQRLAVGMYYYEQYSVKEIAETLGVSANTVKSRLSYARKKIEEQVEELKKKGTSLYGLSPIPFLLWLFKNQDMQAAAPDISVAEKEAGAIMAAKTAVEAIAEESVAAGEASATAGESIVAGEASALVGESVVAGEASATVQQTAATDEKASTAAGKGIAVKAVVGVLVVGLVGGTAFYVAHRQPENAAPIETAVAQEPENETDSESIVTKPETEVADEQDEATGVMLAGYYIYDEDDGDSNAYVWRSSVERSDVKNIIFLDSLDEMPDDAWDVSQNEDGSVMVWVTENEDDMYDLYISADGGVLANEDSSYLFSGFTGLASISFNNCFNTMLVTDMRNMFSDCENLTELDVSEFDTSQVTNMMYIFSDCKNLTELNISGFDTSQVTNMSGMFDGCESLTELDVSGFDTSRVNEMTSMFYWCRNLVNIDVSGFDTSQVTLMCFMFGECNSLESLDLSGFDTSQVMDMNSMFMDCTSLTELDLSGFDTSQVSGMGFALMFMGCRNLTKLDVSNFDTSQATTLDGMFMGCTSLVSLDVSSFDTSSVTVMNSMFCDCASLTELDTSGFDMSNVIDDEYMFSGCIGLGYEDEWYSDLFGS